jgi:putative ABC transport system ATP-binding protein
MSSPSEPRNGGFPVVAERLSKRYGSGTAVVADVSLAVGAGEFLSVVGPSGSGKTTLLNLLAGLDRPSAGRVVVAGRDLARLTVDALSDLRLRQIGFVFQSFNLFPSFTVEENVAWPLEFLGVGRRAAARRAAVQLERVGLAGDRWRRCPAALSGGEQQRVALARALVTEPALLVADEPTGNLDSRTGQTILDLFSTLHRDRGLTIILVTHSAVAAAYAERTIELLDGRIVRDIRTSRPLTDGEGAAR